MRSSEGSTGQRRSIDRRGLRVSRENSREGDPPPVAGRKSAGGSNADTRAFIVRSVTAERIGPIKTGTSGKTRFSRTLLNR